jgi:uncharacterized caspase-like protein
MTSARHLLKVFFALAAMIVIGATPGFADKRVALIIGNGAYKYTPALPNPQNDAADVAEALKAIGFEVTLKTNLEKRQMDQVIAQFARDGKTADAALFYYAGHGMQFEGKNFVMPIDAELQDEVSLRYEMTSLDDIKAALERSPGVKIMVLDACRNNPLADQFVRSISLTTRDIPRVQGYARLEKSQGMIVVYATQADEVARDGGGRNSPFTTAFLKEIQEPGLEVGTMFRRIGADVYAATYGLQSPELSISMVPEYYLNQSETDQMIWARIRTHADVPTLKEFLGRYPNSFYAPDARALLDLLEREARETADRGAAARELAQREAEAERLQQEQAKSERTAAEASARERQLTEKISAAEDQRRKLEQELADRTANQAAVEARNQAELERLQKDREQHEAELRAQIDKEQATASQLEKERLLREAQDREHNTQAEQDKARAERERVANEEKAHELQLEAERAEALKAQVAKLEQEAEQAKATTQAEVQKAEEAKRVAAEAAKTVAAAAADAPPHPNSDTGQEPRALVAPIESELRRIGCYDGATRDWDAPEVRLGVAEYARFSKLSATPSLPDNALLDNLKNLHDRVCPLECSSGEIVVNGRCAARPALRVTAIREVEAPRKAPREERAPAPRKHQVAAREAGPTHVRPASSGHCFTFNGAQYCE